MLKLIATFLIGRAEKRVGVKFDYVRKIVRTDIGLLTRYNRLFGFMDPNKNVPAVAYHTARLRGAIAMDCGTCVEAEINLAKNAKISPDEIALLIAGQYDNFAPEIIAVAHLTDAVTAKRHDDPEARAKIIDAWGDAGLIELSFAMNGAALLPGVKRAMGYATSCDLSLMQKIAKPGS